MYKRKTISGFTLVELMVVIAIAAIVATIAVPSMSRWIASQRLQMRAEQLVTLFQFSRSEAMRLNTPVIICQTTIKDKTATSNVCNPFNSNTIQGLIAWKDTAIKNEFKPNDADDTKRTPILRTVAFNQNNQDIQVVPTIQVFNSNGNQIIDEEKNITRIGFMPNGMFGWTEAADGGTNWTLGTGYIRFTLIDHNHENPTITRKVVIDPSGRALVCDAKQAATSICNKP